MKATCDRCFRRVPVMPAHDFLPCAHVTPHGMPCLDGDPNTEWFAGPGRRRDAYIGRPGKYDVVAHDLARNAEWDL